MWNPHLEINLSAIETNARKIRMLAQDRQIAVLAVTKGCHVLPPVVTAILRGGITGLADSRFENLVELREQGFTQSLTLLRIPRLSKAGLIPLYANCSVNSELEVIQAISRANSTGSLPHKIILMVDVGDLREGVMPEQALFAAGKIARLPGIVLAGVGTNMGCFGGILPSPDNLGLLAEIAANLQQHLGFPLEVVSGGGTSSLIALEEGWMPAGINQLRIGEGILLGTDTTNNRAIPWLRQDGFRLHAEIIELKEKPSLPMGEFGRDAFGRIPRFVDRGLRQRAILALGRGDVPLEALLPEDPGLTILGGSSDHTIIDVTDCQSIPRIGETVAFRLTYPALLAATGSRYIAKRYRGGSACSYYSKTTSQKSSAS